MNIQAGTAAAWIAYQELLRDEGVSLLLSTGVTEYGLNRMDALEAIKLLRSGRLVILGGDVYVTPGGKVIPAYANWYCPKLFAEDAAMAVERCAAASAKYVADFPAQPDGECLFVIVVKGPSLS
ncbi:MAG: Immunity protein 40 [Labilithrix sp.]|nr:Immunity protein 40 [Labilithrix sp.]